MTISSKLGEIEGREMSKVVGNVENVNGVEGLLCTSCMSVRLIWSVDVFEHKTALSEASCHTHVYNP
jgi:hypothetical protein